MDYLSKVNQVTLLNGVVHDVLHCEGLDYFQGVPATYGIRKTDGELIFIPRCSVAGMRVPCQNQLPGERPTQTDLLSRKLSIAEGFIPEAEADNYEVECARYGVKL
jgi:hypothetical protein